MAGSVPNVGDRQRIVGPAAAGPGGDFRLRADANPYLTGDVTLASGTFITLNQVGQTITINCTASIPSPSASTPPEVRQAGEVGVSALYARGDHTHQSPVIYWTQSGAPNDNVVSNRASYGTVTSSSEGGTNFCSYLLPSIIDGLIGSFATISGGRDCSAHSDFDVVGGGDGNACIVSSLNGANVISGGAFNSTHNSSYCSIAGGASNTIENIDDSDNEIVYCHAWGGENEVYRSGGTSGGILARSYMPGEFAYACGNEASIPGYAQESKVVVSGRTLGLSANESVQLRQWTGSIIDGIIFQAYRAITAELRIVAVNVASGAQASWVIGLSASTVAAGVISILNSSVIYSYQSAGALTWSYTLGTTGNEMTVSFSTGLGTTAEVNVAASLVFTQVVSETFLGEDIMSAAAASMTTELRAPLGFENLYQGVTCDTPIILSPSSSGLDPGAEATFSALKNEFNKTKSYPINSDAENGIGPFLIAGTPVPMYSSVCLQIPAILATKGDSFVPYVYRIIWRVRTYATSQRGNGSPFHGRNSSPGPSFNGQGQVFNPAPGGAVWSGKCQTRLPVYGADNSIVYAQTEPTTQDAAFQNVYTSLSRVIKVNQETNDKLPILPAFESGQYARADITQGFSSTVGGHVSHISYLERSLGDELCVLVWREPTGEDDTWDFGGSDADFPFFYSRNKPGDRGRGYGLIVNTGLAP